MFIVKTLLLPAATALLLHSPRERRSGSLSSLLLKPEQDPEELWLLEQRGGQCCSPSAQLLAARGSFALKTSSNAWRQFPCPDRVPFIGRGQGCGYESYKAANVKEGIRLQVSLKPGFSDPGPAGDGGGMRAARD